jgi:hypothetical protein
VCFVCQFALVEAVSEAVVEWEVRNQGYRKKKNVERGTEIEMRCSEVMALVFCLVGSCPTLLPSRSLATSLSINRTAPSR